MRNEGPPLSPSEIAQIEGKDYQSPNRKKLNYICRQPDRQLVIK